uniref:Uncharacterized mitochondrial protein AtMg00810-like n=1 Tax=Tanacetum cinerariifolium TaxID=118510 RepID=A0A6L2LQH0_TANCI|nr:uncharacterized mitochondrial protein AtMg00810-like [Tanacetum cinerariifolium]
MARMVKEKDGKSGSILIDTEKPLLKDPDGGDVDVHIYWSMIGSLIQRIFRYLKGKPHLGLWYPKDSPFKLVAYSDSDYTGASLDRKSITGGYQFLGCRLIYWQCKKQTVVSTSSIEAEYVVVASCCAQLLWIQNQLLDYGKFDLTDGKSGSILIDTEKPLLKDPDGGDVDVHIYWSMIGSLMYLTSSRPDIMHFLNVVSSKLMLFILTIEAAHLMLLGHKYTSPALTQKVFANMKKIGKGFLGVDTFLFDGMLVQQQVQVVEDAAEDEDDDNEVSAKPTPPLSTPATPPPSHTQEHIPSLPQAQTAQPSSPPPQQPSQTTDILQSAMTLLNTLLETCATLTKKVANLEQDKIAQAIEIIKLKQRVRRNTIMLWVSVNVSGAMTIVVMMKREKLKLGFVL